MLMDESIRLDRRSFEALAGDTRVKVLKSLLKRRKTLTELAQELGFSASTMKEHLEVLSGAELVVQVDEGRKWKYYELTRKGRQIAEPHELRVWIILGLSIIAAGAAVFNLFAALQAPVGLEGGIYAEAAPYPEMRAAGAEAPAMEAEIAASAAPQDEDYAADSAAPEEMQAAEMGKSSEVASGDVPFMQVGMAAAAVLILAWAIFYARGEGVI